MKMLYQKGRYRVFQGEAGPPVPHQMISEDVICSPWPGLGTFPEFSATESPPAIKDL
jgi:hypothetical protein